MKFTAALSSLVLLATVALSAPTPAAAPARRAASTKRGLAYNSDQAHAAKLFTSGKISWGYNWGATRGYDDLPSNVQEYVPMCWGDKVGGNTFEGCKRGLEKSVAQGAKHILGFNEPDIGSQANMSPQFAAQKYRELINPYGNRAKLGAPAVSNSEDPGKGLDWLNSFLHACSDCQIDFIPIHWYASNGDIDYFKKCVLKAKEVARNAGFDVPIWVTEFGAPTADTDVQVKFVKKAMDWMDNTNVVERYSYFGALEGHPAEAKMVTNGVLNAVGLAYNS